MLESDLGFPRSYEVGEFGGLPGTGTLKVPLIYFPPPKGRPEHNGEWLKVKVKSGKTWVGVFAFGLGSRTAVHQYTGTEHSVRYLERRRIPGECRIPRTVGGSPCLPCY